MERPKFLGLLGICCIAAIVFGGIAGIAYFPGQPARGAAFGAPGAALAGIPITVLIVGAEIFVPRTRLGLSA